MTSKEIRDELMEIRYYLSHKPFFDKSADYVGKNEIELKIAKYNKYVRSAAPRLYELYIYLYIENNSQESLAEKMGYCSQYISKLNIKLIEYFRQRFNEDEQAQ
jgi:hypothetical protein